jgi:rRNA maturation RNase YbeY
MPLPTKSNIYFFFQNRVHLRNRKQLKKFIASIFIREGKTLESLNYIFCSDPELRSINRQYLKHDYFTDIVTFGLSEKGKAVEGEIYISVDRVRDNAKFLEVSLTEELHRVIFHGALHLCGYRDKSKKEIQAMRQQEDKCLIRYFQGVK